MNNLTAENMLSTLPSVLKADSSTEALAEVTADAIVQRIDENQVGMVYISIDIQEEELLDILAKDFKVDWWSADYTLEEKRDILKKSWHVHRLLGTKAAVESAISSVYGSAHVEEWFEYGGEPYHFRVLIDSEETMADSDKLKTVISKIIYYKNLRSELDDINFDQVQELPKRYIGRAVQASNITTLTMRELIDPTDYVWLTDEASTMLVDEGGEVLLD